ncbi:MAG: PD-(D/E)XK nuclease family protein, partial [Gemmatimonadetes bacterium]|nr:PD-(D/E)XK nuclease family protein [Gemmatimonadota bacterium]
MTDEWNAEAAEAVLEAFRQEVPPRPERPPTLMEISGYPHYENVCSNILAFFFDPDKPHGLGTLFLDALVQIGCIKDPGTIGVDVHVNREEATSSGNRIDLLIRSHSHAIVIENKIFAGADYNPLGDYSKHLCSLKQPNKRKFLLTLHPVRGDSDVGHGFTNITYADFVSNLRGLLGEYVAGADTRYLTIMLDFLNTLDHLREGVAMNQKLVDFLAKDEHFAEAQRFFKEVDTFREELRKRVSDLAAHIKVDAPSCNVKQRMFRGKSELG